jgi:Protein of unknown function (DUF2380)
MKFRTIAAAMLALSLSAGAAMATEPVAVAVADFDYSDASGEVADQAEAHRARVAAFGQLLRDSLVADGNYRVVRLDCPGRRCTAASMPPDDFVAAARRTGARLVVYGGIRKMSTLVQWGEVQLVDLDRNELLLRRTVTFRGDTDEAFRRAAGFVGETLKDVMPKP